MKYRILRGACPKQNAEILRFAQDDSERTQNDALAKKTRTYALAMQRSLYNAPAFLSEHSERRIPSFGEGNTVILRSCSG